MQLTERMPWECFFRIGIYFDFIVIECDNWFVVRKEKKKKKKKNEQCESIPWVCATGVEVINVKNSFVIGFVNGENAIIFCLFVFVCSVHI